MHNNDKMVKFYETVGTDFSEKDIQNLTETVKSPEAEFLVSDEDDSSEEVKPGKWAVTGTAYFPCENVANSLKTGVYSIGVSWTKGIYLKYRKINMDDLIELPDAASTEVVNHIKEFWDLKTKFSDMGFLYKRGIMLYGPPGSGKTATVFQTVKFMTENKGITILAGRPAETIEAIQMARVIEPERPIMVVLEDIDDTVRNYGDKSLTALLDGEHNTDNIVYLATTNYPERLPPRLIQRPSRFDVVEFIDMPGESARKTFLDAKTDLSPSEISTWVEKTEGMSIAHLKELITLVLIYGKPLEEAISRIVEMGRIVPSSKSSSLEHTLNISVEHDPIKVNVDKVNLETPTFNVRIKEPRTKTIRIKERDENGQISTIEEVEE